MAAGARFAVARDTGSRHHLLSPRVHECPVTAVPRSGPSATSHRLGRSEIRAGETEGVRAGASLPAPVSRSGSCSCSGLGEDLAERLRVKSRPKASAKALRKAGPYCGSPSLAQHLATSASRSGHSGRVASAVAHALATFGDSGGLCFRKLGCLALRSSAARWSSTAPAGHCAHSHGGVRYQRSREGTQGDLCVGYEQGRHASSAVRRRPDEGDLRCRSA